MTLKPLFPDQAKAIDGLRTALRAGYKRPVLQLPTGGGKTRIAAEIINMARAKDSRVIFTAPAISLIDQTVRAFAEEGISEVGVLQAQHQLTDPSKPVQIASIQTLARRSIPEANLVIVDECHRMSEFMTEWMGREEWAHVPFIGLTATPWTKGMGRLYDHLVIGATTADMIEAGRLSKFRVFAPSHPDLSGVKTVAGDYHEGQLSEVMSEPVLVADVVQTWLEKGERRPTFVFAVDRAHARSLAKQFEKAGVKCGYIDAETPIMEREEIRRAFSRGIFEVVCSVGCLTTGVDWDVRCIVLARPTKSEMLFVQMIGRGLRTAPGKDHCLIFDHSDTTLKLGFVTDIHHEQLDDGTLKSKQKTKDEDDDKPLPKECPSCHALKPAGVRKCPVCGFEPQTQSTIKTADGDLVELDAKRQGTAHQASMAEKVRFMGMLKDIQINRHYAEGWTASNYRKKFGVWPNHPEIKYCSRIPSDQAVENWVRSQNIRYAKAREALA